MNRDTGNSKTPQAASMSGADLSVLHTDSGHDRSDSVETTLIMNNSNL